MRLIKQFVLIICCSLGLSIAQADDVESSKDFGEFTVHYSTFNSLFIPADIAAVHNLVRAKDQTLINIAVQRNSDSQSVPAKVTGTAKNLMQQLKTIDFKTIEEPGAVYYIGALRHTNEEVFHLDINIVPEGKTEPLKFRLSRKLYTER
ncbi:DUF4426 domain-containing protein [Saccharophagus sp. K07]|jgi:hypothetical protein|uniref:DUF4426 domain-containing protein n=1 Tax=Saccharophagus sp. K07 TaxID=2283636 RepID=UPI00165264FE|nr:DUF4426 domain-containing protein [Saccharophagus sp. K07]